jgi:glycosyltransferase involved in cell wall biosynthesis
MPRGATHAPTRDSTTRTTTTDTPEQRTHFHGPRTDASEPRTETITLRRRIPWKRVVREERDVPADPLVRRRILEFSGVYGSNLMEEVARYALAVEAIATQRNDFDVIHAHDWMSFPAGLAAARASGKPLVVHVHACEHDRSGDRPNTAVSEIEQLGLDGADRVVCVSHYTAAQLRRHYEVDESKLRIVHNALTQKEQVERVKAAKKIDSPIVLFLGRVTFQKGPDYFLEAASRVVRVRPDVKFVVAGSGDMLPAMIERVARMGLARNVHFTGFLTGEDVERMYAMADVYVMPSVSEPFGIAPLEAMALDTPVILSRQSGVSEVLHSALKVDFWDVADIANKILAVLTYPALIEELRDVGREEVRAMRWERPAGLVRDTYVELVGTRELAGAGQGAR